MWLTELGLARRGPFTLRLGTCAYPRTILLGRCRAWGIPSTTQATRVFKTKDSGCPDCGWLVAAASEKGFVPGNNSCALTFRRGPDGGGAGQGGRSAGQAELSQKIILTSHCLLSLSGELKGGEPHQPLPHLRRKPTRGSGRGWHLHFKMKRLYKHCGNFTNNGKVLRSGVGEGICSLPHCSKVFLLSPKESLCALLYCHVQLFATLWTVSHQAALSMGISGQESWSGLPCLPAGDLPEPAIELVSPKSLALGRQVLYH